MVWAGISADYRTDLVVFDGYVNADVYVDEVYDQSTTRGSINLYGSILQRT